MANASFVHAFENLPTFLSTNSFLNFPSGSCRSSSCRKSAIFSLRKYSGGLLLDVMATIEVNVSLRKIVQAKAKMNKPISGEARKHLETWAMNEGMEMSHYL